MGQFKPMPKMMTTEPSVELKLKKGGHVANEKSEMKRVRAESKETAAEERNEKAELNRVGKELKKHESMRASKGHPGLKKGGRFSPKMAPPAAGPGVPGGLLGGLQATMADPSRTTGGVRDGNAGGYKKGGAVKFIANMSGAQNLPKLPKKTGVVKNGNDGGYKKGGAVKFIANMSGDANPKQLPKKTGGVKNQKPGGFKDGGYAAMSCKAVGGHASMKKMSKF